MAARPLRAEECRLTQPLSGRTPSHSLRSDTLRSQGLPLRGVRDVHPISGDPGIEQPGQGAPGLAWWESPRFPAVYVAWS